MPIDKGGKIDPIKPPVGLPEGNCFSCSTLAAHACPFEKDVAADMLRDTEAMRGMALADTLCGGENYGTTIKSASMRAAMAQNKVLSTRQFGTVRVVEAVEETPPDEVKP